MKRESIPLPKRSIKLTKLIKEKKKASLYFCLVFKLSELEKSF